MNSILIGKIINIHGVKGEVKIYAYTDDVDNLLSLKEVYFDKELTKKVKIISFKVHKGMLLAKLEGINTIEAGESLKNQDIYIIKQELDKLDEDTFYVEDLIGLDVFDMENNLIGKLTYVMPTGANDVYEIDTKENGKIYLPATVQVIKKVDLENKKMYVEIMDGLL
jgi:16S rRNA processing protein RimM